MKRGLTVILIAALMTGGVSGCKKKQTEVTMGNTDINFGDYKDSEDIPSWEGSELKLSVWQDANSPNAYQRFSASPDDSVSPEIERITGVSFDSDNSFDNSGNSFDAKITQIIASGDFPDIGVSLPDLSNLTKTDKLWDIEEYVKKYCPNIMKLFGPDTAYSSVWKEQKEKYGGLYALALGNNTGMLKKMNEDGTYSLTNEQIESAVGKGENPYGYVYIREDILKKLYPEAHTSAELEEIFKNKGSFTKEEIFDVPLKSTQDFIDMLYKIQEMNLSDDEGKVYTMYTHEGSDNWTALTEAGGSIFGYKTDYFNYIDLESGKAAYTFKEDWFKNDVLKTYNKLIRDNIVPSENLMDTAQRHKEKLSNARYAVSISPYEPDTAGLKGKYSYRKVYFQWDKRYDKYLNPGVSPDGLKKVSFFKSSLSEDELIQALRCFDFIASLPGQKLTYWGTKSAGLYTEAADGSLKYKDDKLANQVMGIDPTTDLMEKYGLCGGVWPGHPFVKASCYAPKLFYSQNNDWKSAYNPNQLSGVGIDLPPAAKVNIYDTAYTATIPAVAKFWQARNAFEDAITQIFAAKDDAEFEARYSEMVALAEKNGLTDETLSKFQEEFDKDNDVYRDKQIEFYNSIKK